MTTRPGTGTSDGGTSRRRKADPTYRTDPGEDATPPAGRGARRSPRQWRADITADLGTEQYRPGSGLGLPEDGPGSLGSLLRRVIGLCIDWAAARLITGAFFDGNEWVTLLIFGLIQVLLVGTLAASPGHLAAGLRLERVDGGWPGPARAVVRTLLLCLVLPALVFDRDQRGAHDRVAGTVLVRR